MTASEGTARGGRPGRRLQLAREFARLVVEQGPGEWVADAACRALPDPDLMWPTARPGTPLYDRQVEAARAVCAGCPVRAECLSHALAVGEQGVWGGTDEDERRALNRAAATDEEAA